MVTGQCSATCPLGSHRATIHTFRGFRTVLLRLPVVCCSCPSPLLAPAPAAAQAGRHLPPPPPGWTGSIGGGLAITSGNSDTSTTNVGYTCWKDHGTNVIFKSAGLLPGGLERRLERGPPASTPVFHIAAAFRVRQTTFARQLAIDYILAPTAGLSYKVVATERTEWMTDGSAGVVFEKNKGLDVDTSGALIAGEKLTHKFAEKTKFVHAATALWKMKDFDDAFYTFSAGLLTSIAGNFDLKTSSSPPTRTS
jgi:hypothetical protein